MANKTQIYIDTIDNSSKVMKDIEDSVSKLRIQLTKLGNESDNVYKKNKGMFSSFENLKDTLTKNIGKIALLGTAFLAIKGQAEVLSDFLKDGLQLNIEEDAAKRGIAGILASVYQLKKEGKDLMGIDKFNASLSLSEDIIKKLKLEALRTGASFKELIDAFQSAVGQGASKGMSVNQVADIATIVANAGKAMGMDGSMVGQELRALISGQVTGDAAIGTSLGLGPGGANAEAYKEALKKGGGEAYDFLMQRLEQFTNAGISQAQTIGGVFAGIADSYSIFQQESTKSLGNALKGIQPIADSLFDNVTGNFSKDLDGIKITLLTLSEFVGQNLVGAFDLVVSSVKDISNWLLENQQYASSFAGLWYTIVDVVSNTAEAFGAILGTIGAIVNTFISLLFLSTSVDKKAQDTLTVFTIIQGVLASINIAVALISDTVKIVADTVRLVLGGALNAILGFVSKIVSALGKVAEWTGADGISKSLKQIEQDLDDFNSRKTFEIIGEDNSIANIKDKFTATSKAILDGADRISASGKVENEAMSKYLQELKDIRSGKGISAGITTTAPKANNKDSSFSSKATNDLLKSYEKELSAFKNAIGIKQRYNQLFYSNYKKNIEDFYNEKESLDKQMFDAEMNNYNKQLEQLEKTKGKGTKEEQLATENKITEAIKKKENAEAEYQLKIQETIFARTKEFRELDKSIEDFKSKIADLQGFNFESKTIKLNIEIEDLKNKFQSVDAMQPLIQKYEELAKRQLSYDRNIKNIAIEEDALAIKRDSGAITQIEYNRLLDEQLNNRISLLQKERDLIAEGPVSDDSIARVKELNNEIGKLKNQTEATAKTLANDLKNSTKSLFEDLMTGTKSWKDALLDFFNSIHANISKLVAQQLMGQLGGLGGGGGSGDWFSSIAGGITSLFGMSTGGGMRGGDMYKINEVGQEIFVPNKNGYMLNATQAKQAVADGIGGGRGGNTNITVNVKANDEQSFRNSRDQLGVTVNSALARARRNQ